MYERNLNPRLWLVFVFFILFFVLLSARLIYVQALKSKDLKALAGEQHNLFTEIPPQRGVIFDRKFKELAMDTICYSVFATKEVKVGDAMLGKLSSVLEIDNATLDNKLKLGRNFVWLKRKVNPEVIAVLKDLNISGIGQVKEYQRLYPNGPLAAHLLGFCDIDNKGLEGIEYYCDAYLTGIKGWRLAQRDARRQELICWGYQSITPTTGYNVVLSLDSVVQDITERHLQAAARKYKAISATAIVMVPATGEILALANYPAYDINNFGAYGEEVRRNLAVTDVFEPGSSFKFVTAAAALEERKVKLADVFYCERGNYKVAGRVLHDYRPYAKLNFQEVIEHSSNIGTVKVAQLLGSQTLYNYIMDFGFGSLTGIDLPGEAKGIVRPPAQWSKVSITAIPMGQEVAVTPIQLISGMSCIANDGVLVKPQLLKFIQRQDGQILKTFLPQNVRRVISTQTAAQLKQILAGVVERGTGKEAQVPGYPTAGKTGTGQKAKPNGGYYQHKYVASFVGFVPVDKPEIAILVLLNEPRPQYFGGVVAAPVFKNIAVETLRYLRMCAGSKAQDYETERAD